MPEDKKINTGATIGCKIMRTSEGYIFEFFDKEWQGKDNGFSDFHLTDQKISGIIDLLMKFKK